jgi:hypothetical protein
MLSVVICVYIEVQVSCFILDKREVNKSVLNTLTHLCLSNMTHEKKGDFCEGFYLLVIGGGNEEIEEIQGKCVQLMTLMILSQGGHYARPKPYQVNGENPRPQW